MDRTSTGGFKVNLSGIEHQISETRIGQIGLEGSGTRVLHNIISVHLFVSGLKPNTLVGSGTAQDCLL